jgi:hypothetical protein
MICLILQSCATSKPPELTSNSPLAYSLNETKEGLIVAVNPVTDKQGETKWFGKDILADGLLPIQIIVENRNASRSFIISKEEVLLKSASSGVTTTSQQATIGNPTPGLVTALVLPNPIIASFAISAAAHEQVMQYNLGERELAKQTISPNGHADGFVYYQFPKSKPLDNTILITVRIISLGTNNPISFEFNVPLQHNTP